MATAEHSAQKKIRNGSSRRGKPNAARGKPNAADISPRADLSNLRILQDRFVFDICSGTFHRVSETAAFILTELKRKTPTAEIVTDYARRYEISQAIAERDVELFLNDLSVAGLPMHGVAHPQI